MSENVSTISVVTLELNTVWCAPPPRIQHAAARLRSGFGCQTARATGNLGSGSGDGTTTTSFAIILNLLPLAFWIAAIFLFVPPGERAVLVAATVMITGVFVGVMYAFTGSAWVLSAAVEWLFRKRGRSEP